MAREVALPTLADVPSAQHDLFYWSCFLLGCGAFMPFEVLGTAVDYFNEAYADYEAVRWTMTCYFMSTLLASLGNSFCPPKGVGHLRISLGIFGFSILLAVIPVMDWTLIRNHEATDGAFCLLLLCCTLIGTFNGLAMGSFAGFVTHLPFRHYQGYVRGLGFSGVIASALRASTKVAFVDSKNGLCMSSWIFFFFSSLLCSTCLLVQRYVIVPNSVWIMASPVQQEAQGLLDDCHTDDRSPSPLWPEYAGNSWRTTVQKIRLATVNMFVINFVMTVLFPGVASDVENEALGDWYGVMLIFFINVSSFATRLFPERGFLRNHVIITVLVWVRTLLIPFTFFTVQYFPDPFIVSTLFLLLGASSGYMLTCCFKMAQDQVQGRNEAFISGNILSFATMFGFSTGSFGSLVWSALD